MVQILSWYQICWTGRVHFHLSVTSIYPSLQKEANKSTCYAAAEGTVINKQGLIHSWTTPATSASVNKPFLLVLYSYILCVNWQLDEWFKYTKPNNYYAFEGIIPMFYVGPSHNIKNPQNWGALRVFLLTHLTTHSFFRVLIIFGGWPFHSRIAYRYFI